MNTNEDRGKVTFMNKKKDFRIVQKCICFLVATGDCFWHFYRGKNFGKYWEEFDGDLFFHLLIKQFINDRISKYICNCSGILRFRYSFFLSLVEHVPNDSIYKWTSTRVKCAWKLFPESRRKKKQMLKQENFITGSDLYLGGKISWAWILYLF